MPGGEFALPSNFIGALAAPPEARESFLRQYWRIFFKRRLIILAITAACVGLGILIAMLTRLEYAATVTIQVSRESAKVLNIEGVDTEESANPWNQEFYQTQYALLKSRSLSEAVVRDLGLSDNYLFLAAFDPEAVEEIKKMPRDERLKLATGIVNGNTIVAPVRESSIIDVRFQSPNPAMAATVANSIAENFVQSNLTRRFEAAAYARQFIQNRLNQVRSRLEESERKAVEYAAREGLVKIDTGIEGSQQSLVNRDLAQYSQSLGEARAARVAAEAQYRAGTGGSIAAQSLTNQAVNQLRQQRAALIGELSKVESNFGPEYPAVIALRSQVAELDRQINREQSRIGTNVSQDMLGKYRQALQTEQALEARVNALKSQLQGEQNRSIQYQIILRDVDTNRALYDALLQRFKEVGVAGGIGTNNISIIDRALVPEAPFKPNLVLNIILGLLIGLLIGALTAVMLEQLEEAAVLPDDFHRKLGIPLLGATPKLRATSEVQDALLEAKSPLSEAYFSILTSIQFSTSHGAPTSMMLTSAQAREGKSTTAMALSQALAAVGARVLLIDADMRNPSMHKLLQRPLQAGLSNLLTGQGEFDKLVQPSNTPNLSVMMAGNIPPNPAELLSSGAVDQIIREATSKFDHVIIDGPPILGLADAPLLTRTVEATVLVVESGRTRATQARHAIDRLLAVRGNVIGAVLSKFDMRNAGYGYGYGYNYNYGAS